jgi:hypothetical protein
MKWEAAALAGVVAFLVVVLELITSKYARTAKFAVTAWPLYVYGFIYAVIAAFAQAFSLAKINGGDAAQGAVVSNLWVQALIVGISVKAFLHIRLFSVGSGTGSFPVGIESLTQLFEPWLLNTLDLDHAVAKITYLQPKAAKYTDLAKVKADAIAGVPPFIDIKVCAGFATDVSRATTTLRVMELYVDLVGTKYFNLTFP